MLRLAFDFIITWRETRTRPNAYHCRITEATAYCPIFRWAARFCTGLPT